MVYTCSDESGCRPAPGCNHHVRAALCPAGLRLSGAGYKRSRLRRDGDSFLTGVTHGHEDRSGRTASVTKCDVPTKKSRVDDVCTMGAERSAFVAFLEDCHDLGLQITYGLMIVISA